MSHESNSRITIHIDGASLLWLVAAVLAVWLLQGMASLLGSLTAALVLGFICEPAVQWFERKKISRATGSAIVMVLTVLFFGILLMLIVPTLLEQISHLLEKLPSAVTNGTVWIEKTFHIMIPKTTTDIWTTLTENLQNVQKIIDAAASQGSDLLKNGALSLWDSATSAIDLVSDFTVVVLFLYFGLVEWPEIQAFVQHEIGKRLSGKVRARFAYAIPLTVVVLRQLLRGQIVVAGILSVVYIVGLFVCGVPLALAIGILAGLAYMIPFASPVVCVALSLASSLLVLQDEALWPVVGSVVIAIFVQVLEGTWLTPRIVGESAGLSPFATMLAVALGGAVGGFVGILFSLPIAAVVAALLRPWPDLASPPVNPLSHDDTSISPPTTGTGTSTDISSVSSSSSSSSPSVASVVPAAPSVTAQPPEVSP